jgi:hypothetical protein
MGYYTQYTIDWAVKDEDNLEEVNNALSQIEEMGLSEFVEVVPKVTSLRDAVEDFMNSEESSPSYGQSIYSLCEYAGEIKWYEHDKEMLAASRKFPSVLFTLSGEGEESGDFWRRYYKNGKCQEARAQIVYAEFDEGKLK